MIDLLRALGVLMIILYVIYTRLLSLETKKMAEATMGLLKEQKGSVLAELVECECNFEEIAEDVKIITETLHMEDKGFTKQEFDELIKKEGLHAVALVLKNWSSRPIEGKKIEYKIRHTGSDNIHDIICDISKEGRIEAWKEKSFTLIIVPEGEIELVTSAFNYLDASGTVQRANITKEITLTRIRKPEKSDHA